MLVPNPFCFLHLAYNAQYKHYKSVNLKKLINRILTPGSMQPTEQPYAKHVQMYTNIMSSSAYVTMGFVNELHKAGHYVHCNILTYSLT